MDYIKEELNHPLGRPENCGQIYWRPENCGQVYWRPENCGQVYWRAMRMLQGVSRAVYDSTCFVSSRPFVKRGRAQSPLWNSAISPLGRFVLCSHLQFAEIVSRFEACFNFVDVLILNSRKESCCLMARSQLLRPDLWRSPNVFRNTWKRCNWSCFTTPCQAWVALI